MTITTNRNELDLISFILYNNYKQEEPIMRKAYLIDQKVINIDSHNPNGQLAQASKECSAVATPVC